MKRALFAALACALAGCATVNYQDTSDAARRRQILGRWYDQYMEGASYAQGETTYRSDGTFTARYQAIAPGTSLREPEQRSEVQWSGKWRVAEGQLIEDITASSDFTRTPADRPMIRFLGRVNEKRLSLRNLTGNVNEYARQRPPLPKVRVSE